MARVDPILRDLVLTSTGDLSADDNPVAEELTLRLLTERGSAWWDLTFGSRLAQLAGEKAGPDLERRVEGEVRGALKPMVDAGAITSLQVTVSRGMGRVDLEVRAMDARRRPVQFTTFVRM